jgi:hypothetical protein
MPKNVNFSSRGIKMLQKCNGEERKKGRKLKRKEEK